MYFSSGIHERSWFEHVTLNFQTAYNYYSRGRLEGWPNCRAEGTCLIMRLSFQKVLEHNIKFLNWSSQAGIVHALYEGNPDNSSHWTPQWTRDTVKNVDKAWSTLV